MSKTNKERSEKIQRMECYRMVALNRRDDGTPCTVLEKIDQAEVLIEYFENGKK